MNGVLISFCSFLRNVHFLCKIGKQEHSIHVAPPVATIHSSCSSIPQFINRLKTIKKVQIQNSYYQKKKPKQKNPPFWIISKSLFVAVSPQLGPFLKPLAVFHQYYSSLSLCFLSVFNQHLVPHCHKSPQNSMPSMQD